MFNRSVTYTVNNYHKHHVTVLAEVVPVALELSTEELVLKPSFGLPAEAGEHLILSKFSNKLYFFLPFRKRQVSDYSKLKEFSDDNFIFD